MNGTLENTWENEAQADWYRRLVADLKAMAETERTSLLRIKHQMGLRILGTREELIKQGVVKDAKGWTGILGRLMQRISVDLDYSLGELYDAMKLVEKFPEWTDFAGKEFEVSHEVDGVSSTVRISGENLSWHQVQRNVLYPTPKYPAPVQTQRAQIACVFKSEACGGDTKRVEICGHHMGDFVVWMNVRKLKGYHSDGSTAR